jgi:hypothetical protein
MKLTLANIIFLFPLTTSVKVSYNTLSYNSLPYTLPTYSNHLPWHVCPTFPHCALDHTTGVWYSDPEVSIYSLSSRNIEGKKIHKELKASLILRESDDSFTKCMFEEEYCSTSESIKIYGSDDVDSPSACQQHCEDNDDCKFWTFLILRGKSTCSLLSECSAKTKCPSKLSCSSGNLTKYTPSVIIFILRT